MRAHRRIAICVLLLSCLSLIGAGRNSTARPSSAPRIAADSELSNLTVEVRLRRLHLVRPDLIPYPLDIEVDC
jgi:hypothetical protein